MGSEYPSRWMTIQRRQGSSPAATAAKSKPKPTLEDVIAAYIDNVQYVVATAMGASVHYTSTDTHDGGTDDPDDDIEITTTVRRPAIQNGAKVHMTQTETGDGDDQIRHIRLQATSTSFIQFMVELLIEERGDDHIDTSATASGDMLAALEFLHRMLATFK